MAIRLTYPMELMLLISDASIGSIFVGCALAYGISRISIGWSGCSNGFAELVPSNGKHLGVMSILGPLVLNYIQVFLNCIHRLFLQNSLQRFHFHRLLHPDCDPVGTSPKP